MSLNRQPGRQEARQAPPRWILHTDEMPQSLAKFQICIGIAQTVLCHQSR